MTRITGLTFLLTFAITGCPKPQEQPRRAASARPAAADVAGIPLTAAEKQKRAQARKLGYAATMQLTMALGKRVFTAMRAKGPAGAIAACSLDAMPITQRVQRALAAGMKIRRTSHRVRNPANAPDAAEKRVLAAFLAQVAKGQTPKPHLEFAMIGGQRGYRYFQPIGMGGMCVKCHGPRAGLSPAIQAVLAKRYPKDQAVDFKAGDLRGIFSLKIPAAALSPKP